MQTCGQIQERAPLWEALANHAAGRRARFHVPAHGGRFEAFRQLLGSGLRFDLTELDGLDDLHSPSGAIAEAEQLAAASLGADEAHFLVGGTSAGVRALLLATLRPGAQVLIGRDAHRSVVSGIILAGADPVYMRPLLDEHAGRSLGIPASEVKAALSANPGVAACQLTNPNYYGIEHDYQTVFAESRVPLLVDEAHGVHRYYEDSVSRGALAAGAAGTALSMHKSGLALTQSAFVAVRGGSVDRARLHAALRLLQSSSPSYLLLAGLDLGRRELAMHGRELIARAYERRRLVAERISRIDGLSAWAPAGQGMRSEHPLRLVVDVAGLGITGWQAAEFLTGRGIDTELADFSGVLLAPGLFAVEADDRRLISALTALSRERRSVPRPASAGGWPALYGIPRDRALTPREAFFASVEYVPLSEIVGRIAADVVCPYPPGVPLVVPGEVFSADDVTTIETVLRAGGRVQGVDRAGRVSAVI